MSDCKEWIKSRMAILKKQANFSFNQDLFISILLCLISGRDKHLVLTAPPDRLSEVTQMAAQISRGIFGFTTSKLACNEDQVRNDLIEALFNIKEEYEPARLNPTHFKTRSHESSILSHKPSRSVQTIDSRNSEKSQTSANQHNNRNTSVKFSLLDEDESHTAPINPMDFNLRKNRGTSIFLSPKASSQCITQKDLGFNKKDKTRLLEPEDLKRSHSALNKYRKMAQTIIIQGLDVADISVQSLLLELIITKELRFSNVKYTLPKPFFLVIAVLPQGYNRLSISSQLMDRFFVSYNFEDDMFPHTTQSTQNAIYRQPSIKRAELMKYEEIRSLSSKAAKVHINIDITRYVRDIVVGIRTHPRVKGGLTARCSQDLITVTKSLATLFQREYLTPDLVTIAAEKVFSHRLHILAINDRDDQMEKEDMSANIPSDIVAEILRVIYVPV